MDEGKTHLYVEPKFEVTTAQPLLGTEHEEPRA